MAKKLAEVDHVEAEKHEDDRPAVVLNAEPTGPEQPKPEN
jgi:hypothetical protein